MEKKEYVSPSFEVTEMELGPVLDVISKGQENEDPAAPPFAGSFDGSDDDDDDGRKGHQGDEDLLE
jgi:hypothetical protein